MLSVLLLLLAGPPAAATPAPAATRPTPVPAADPYRPRSLSDIARERRGAPKTGGSFSVSGSGGGDSTPPGTAGSPSKGDVTLRVEAVQRTGLGHWGSVSVSGQVRNTGQGPACSVHVALKIYDDRARFLASGEAYTSRIEPGGVATFQGSVQAPPNVLNPENRVSADRVELRYLGRADAEIAGFSSCR